VKRKTPAGTTKTESLSERNRARPGVVKEPAAIDLELIDRQARAPLDEAANDRRRK